MAKFDIVTFGSASQDVFAGLENAEMVENEKFLNKGICFNLGSKIGLKSLYFASGGAGTNTAATFANQGFKTAFAGAVGDDVYGQEIVTELKSRGIETGFVKKTKKQTNYSIVFSYGNEDRTIFAFRGASEDLDKKDIPFKKLSAKWFYIATLSGKTAKLTKEIVNYAFKNKIKIAFNPGNSQLLLPELNDIIKKADILILNQEEASILTKIPYSDEKEIFKKIDVLCPGVAIMTKGADGVVVSDGMHLYSAKSPDVEVVERTGAGDAFGSGFVSGFIISGGNVEEGIQLGLANSVSCIRKIGAKNGLIKKGAKIKKINIAKEECCPECDCVIKP
ncbi:MAG: PfkB family carbohydrate kinase [bacterium]|nr:PfkB family carbohydrate kinase [bacterium]